ncbi:hypothetical protein [Alishewanella longhuensis]
MALAPTAMLVAQEAETKPDPKEDDIEIIEVTGFRGSLNVALMAKRDA